jgi:hypothetical protein
MTTPAEPVEHVTADLVPQQAAAPQPQMPAAAPQQPVMQQVVAVPQTFSPALRFGPAGEVRSPGKVWLLGIVTLCPWPCKSPR